MLQAIQQIAAIILVMLVGFLAAKGKHKIITPTVRAGLTGLVINIAMPAVIVRSGNLAISGAAWWQALYVFVFGLVFHFGCFFVIRPLAARFYPTLHEGKAATVCITFNNCVFVGFPILSALHGDQGVFYGSIFAVTYYLGLYTIGTALLQGDKKVSIKEQLLTPFNFALLLMFVLLLTPFKLPAIVNSAVDLMANLCTPLSLLVIGAMVAEMNLKAVLSDRNVYITMAMRLLVIPLLTLLILVFIPWSAELRQALLALSAMPTAAIVPMMAQEHKCAPQFTSAVTVQTTLFFPLTFSIILWLGNLLI